MSYTVQTSRIATAPLTVAQFAPKPGATVGLALPGGGTRAALSALGVLRALAALNPSGCSTNYLSQLLAISSVSGGSWFAVTWSYLPSQFADADFLGTYVPDPASLTNEGGGADDVTVLDSNAFGQIFTHYGFSADGLFNRALALRVDPICPDSRIWSVLVGESVLKPFQLADFANGWLPTHFYTATAATGATARTSNPSLPAYRVMRADATNPRPFLVCNGSQKVMDAGQEYLAPVHFTPWFVGVMAAADGTYSGGNVGGGGVAPFGWEGTLSALNNDQMTVTTASALDLSDIAGVSSAFFSQHLAGRLGKDVNLDPQYACFPVSAIGAPAGDTGVFADGGNLENTGIASLLAYGDVQSIIACVADPSGVSGSGATALMPESIMPLFGLDPQPDKNGHYQPWAMDSADPRRRSQVFDSQCFKDVQNALACASNNGAQAAVALTMLDVIANPWFAVAGGRTVRVLWLTLSPASAFHDLLTDKVQAMVPKSFPNYSILDTERTATEVNLLAHFTGWLVSQSSAELGAIF
jgi:hypothetical protein